MPDLSHEREALVVDIIKALRAHNHQAFLVGGCVRDRLWGIAPKDFDVSTDARPDEIRSLFPGSELVGAKFGVVLVRQSRNICVEVATFRSEGNYKDGRHPEDVQFETDPALDAQRRDFTINGLFEDPLSGRIYDFVGGQGDLRNHVLRTVGAPERRFEEDHLRLLRGVRFAARFQLSVEDETMRAMRRFAPKIIEISAERIRDELVRILTEGGARYGLELLDRTGLLDLVLPELKACQGVAQPPEFHPEGDVWQHVLLMLETMGKPSRTLAWGVLLHDIGKPPTFRVADRIRFDGHAEVGTEMAIKRLMLLKASNDDVERVSSLVANHMRFKDVPKMRISTLKRFLRMPHFEEHLELHRLDCLASNGRTDVYEFVKSKLEEFRGEQLRPPRLLTGDDLINAGYTPGPAFKRVIELTETAQLEGDIETREQALGLARQVLSTDDQVVRNRQA
ncbi:MAG: CCA tRNA nucleotidyltransferase [Bryobacteraceae bacterium]